MKKSLLLVALLSVVAAPSTAATFMPPSVAPKAPSAPGVPAVMIPGLYVHVIDGQVNLSNSAGTLAFGPGQFGYVANPSTPPALVPSNPGLAFTPPPVFNANSNAASNTTGAGAKSNSVDCEVR